MKKLLLIFVANVIAVNLAFSQCQPFIKIDGNMTSASATAATGLSLPVWLKTGQTLETGSMVNSVSVIEFSINPTTNDLSFSQVLSVSSSATVPADKVWKVESIIKKTSFITSPSAIYTTPGTYNFAVPYCASYICIEVWGGGGGAGSTSTYYGGGGGGGGYGQECFTVTPGAAYSVIVGSGGGTGTAGGTSSVGSLISASGGVGGISNGGAGGAGGTSSAAINVNGGTGTNGGSTCTTGGYGGNGGNGGVGGPGTAPGGGGGDCNSSKTGAAGKVIITW